MLSCWNLCHLFRKIVIMLILHQKKCWSTKSSVICNRHRAEGGSIMKPLSVQDNNIIPGRPLVLYHCGHEQCKPSHSFGPAIRPHYLIHFVLHGQGTYHVNGSVYHVGEGEGFLIHPGVTTLYCADDQNPWEYCWIGFDGYDVPTVLKLSGLSHTSLILKDYSNGMLQKDLFSLILAFTERQGNDLFYLGLLYRCLSAGISDPVPHQNRPAAAPRIRSFRVRDSILLRFQGCLLLQ